MSSVVSSEEKYMVEFDLDGSVSVFQNERIALDLQGLLLSFLFAALSLYSGDNFEVLLASSNCFLIHAFAHLLPDPILIF
jgi:hypothetical protein